MSPDESGTAFLLMAALPAALGHLCHLVLAINVASGIGRREAVLDRVRLALFAAFWVSSALLLWGHLRVPWWHWPWPFRAYAWLCTLSGLVIWPASTLGLALRPRPAGIVPGEATRDLDLSQPGRRDDLIGDGPGAWLLRLPGNESLRLGMRDWNVAIPGLPEPLDGLRIVQLTDIHLAPCFRPEFFERVVAACRGWEADLVVLTGDVVEHDAAIAWVEPLLSPLEARLGKLAILGNHDEDHHPAEILAALGRAGFETLDGRWTTIQADGATIAVGGTSAPWGPDVDPAAMPAADLRILLSHSPDRFYRAARWGVDLVLAGHNHGGQIRLPLIGAVFMPSIYSRRFDRGFFRRGRTLMYASDGLAGMHPVRYGCPPEVTRFVLRPAPISGKWVMSECLAASSRERPAQQRAGG